MGNKSQPEYWGGELTKLGGIGSGFFLLVAVGKVGVHGIFIYLVTGSS